MLQERGGRGQGGCTELGGKGASSESGVSCLQGPRRRAARLCLTWFGRWGGSSSCCQVQLCPLLCGTPQGTQEGADLAEQASPRPPSWQGSHPEAWLPEPAGQAAPTGTLTASEGGGDSRPQGALLLVRPWVEWSLHGRPPCHLEAPPSGPVPAAPGPSRLLPPGAAASGLQGQPVTPRPRLAALAPGPTSALGLQLLQSKKSAPHQMPARPPGTPATGLEGPLRPRGAATGLGTRGALWPPRLEFHVI